MKEIKKYLESRIGKYSFFFEDLKSGYVYGYNENVSMTAAGCMKLPIAVSLIKPTFLFSTAFIGERNLTSSVLFFSRIHSETSNSNP